MIRPNDPKKGNSKPGQHDYEIPAGKTPERDAGDDALADTSPEDSRADEKVIVNEQRENKAVNSPSQTAAHTNQGSEEDVINTG